MTTYYRGDTARPAAPALAAGTWLTPDPDVACWYGAAYRYDLDDPDVLDLTELGVDGEGLDEALAESGIDPAVVKPYTEIYQVCEQPAFLAAAAAAGYDLVACVQWHLDRSDEEYEAAIHTGRGL